MLLRTLKNGKLLRSFCQKPTKSTTKVFGFAKGKKNKNRNNKENKSVKGQQSEEGGKMKAKPKEKVDLSKVKMFNFNKLNDEEDKLTPLSLKFSYKNGEKKKRESKLVKQEIVTRIAKEMKKGVDIEKLFNDLTTK